MGYYTEYSLIVKNINSQDNARLLEEIKKRGLIGYVFWDSYYSNNKAEYSSFESQKWYDYEKDMKEISIMFPAAVFELSGEGEDYGDLWRMYFKNGECEFCRGEIIYEEPKKIKWFGTEI